MFYYNKLAANQLLNTSSLIVLILFVNALKTNSLPSSKNGVGDAQSATAAAAGPSVKVLLVENTDTMHAIEEASSLSLDILSQDVPTEQQELREQSTNQTGSLGYRQSSSVSLNLHQREPASDDFSGRSTMMLLHGERRARSDGQLAGLWSELHLPRIKPSWLDVGSRFKITSNSIETMQSMMPAEYMLRQAFDSPVLLKTKLGILEGVRSIKFNKNLFTFLGVPFAEPPIGKLRFKAPRSVEKWDGIMQATKWPPFCVQPSMTLASKSSPVHILTQIMSEDCLYLNIWTPSLKFNKRRKRPVMVWIHGGAFQFGGISVDENDGSALALLGNVVVVTIAYRISALGFLNANNHLNAPNNVGLLDQRLAMEWVQANIKQFGGDPQQVTLLGESAGAHSVGLHMISPPSYPLFKRAILQSGVPISILRSYDVNADSDGLQKGEKAGPHMMAKRLKCYIPSASNELSSSTTTTASIPTTSVDDYSFSENDSPGYDADTPVLNNETLNCMRNKSSLEILKAMGAPGSSGFFPTSNDIKGFFPNGPIMESFEAETGPKIGPQKDFLLGTNTDEGTFMLHHALPSVFPAKEPPKVLSVKTLKEALREEIDRLAGSVTAFSTVSDAQSASGGGKIQSGTQARFYKPLLKTSDSILEALLPKSKAALENITLFSQPVEFGRNVGNLVSDIIFLCPARSLAQILSENGRNVHFYLYEHRSSLSQYHEWFGVTHHDEVEFVFGRPLRMADVYSGKDIEMSQRMIKTWSHFAYTGQMLDQLGVNWPIYGENEAIYMRLNTNESGIGKQYHSKVCNIYDSVLKVHFEHFSETDESTRR